MPEHCVSSYAVFAFCSSENNKTWLELNMLTETSQISKLPEWRKLKSVLKTLVISFKSVSRRNGTLRSSSPSLDAFASCSWYSLYSSLSLASSRPASPEHCPLVDSHNPFTTSTPSPLIHHHASGLDSAADNGVGSEGVVRIKKEEGVGISLASHVEEAQLAH